MLNAGCKVALRPEKQVLFFYAALYIDNLKTD
jgi:hypothetical protein